MLFFGIVLFDVSGFDAIVAPIFLDVVLLFHLDDSFHFVFVFDTFVSLRNLLNSVELLSKQLITLNI